MCSHQHSSIVAAGFLPTYFAVFALGLVSNPPKFALFSNQTVGLMMIAAIVISNVPESIASIGGLKKEKFSAGSIFSIWGLVGMAVTLTTILSFIFLHNLGPNTIGILDSLAAGAMLAMLAGSMMPEAYEEGGYAVSILTIIGFLVTFVISRL